MIIAFFHCISPQTTIKDSMSLLAPTHNDNRTPHLTYANTFVVYYNFTELENRLSGESNVDSILALDDRIREHEEALIKFKRSRNSLLNVHKLPPEVLGNIFHWNVMLKGRFGGLEQRSHNFLLVCHYWFEVASHTPELWNFWGNTLKDWERLYHRSRAAPVDLVLEGDVDDEHLGTTLSDALRDHVSRDAIRRVHLSSEDFDLVSSIILSLTPEREGMHSSRAESIIIRSPPVQVSDFFARFRFPKLQFLELAECTISSWDHLTSRTSALTDLILAPSESTPAPTTSQLLSILASNPTLRTVILSELAVPNDGGGSLSLQVSLPRLRGLSLSGRPQDVFRFLQRLDFPKNLYLLQIFLNYCMVADISQMIGSYLGYYLRARGKSQGGIGITLYIRHDIVIYAGDHVAGGADSAPLETVEITDPLTIYLIDGLPRDQTAGATGDLIACAPHEEVVYFRSWGNPTPAQIIYAKFPNLKALRFDYVPLTDIVPEPTPGGEEGALLSLQHIFLHEIIVADGDWSPLTIFLSHRVATGNPLHTLRIYCCPHICPGLVDSIKNTVSGFKAEHISSSCPFVP